MNDRFAARVGQTIAGKWQLERLIGVGGMAAVYAARHRVGAPVAIKILHPEVARDSELRQRFEREAMVMGRLAHPGSVDVRDIDVTEDGSPYIVMELLEGESLKERAQRLGRIEPAALLRLVDQALDVLAAAHEQGIVHRDIKPDNLFITRDGVLKVLDFGIARMREGAPMTMIGTRLGTLPYMPPEQVRAVNVDHRADIFALGAVMFRILARRRIHEAKTESEMLVKMSAEPAPPLQSVAPQLPAGICAVVDCALAFDRDDRYASARAMQADVRALRAGQAPEHAREPSKVVALASQPTRVEPSGATGVGRQGTEHTRAAAGFEGTAHTRAAASNGTGQRAVSESTAHTRAAASDGAGRAPTSEGVRPAADAHAVGPMSATGAATPFVADAPVSAFADTARADAPPQAPSKTVLTDPGTRVSAGVVPHTVVSAAAPRTKVMAASTAIAVGSEGAPALPPPAPVSQGPQRKKPVAAIFAAIGALVLLTVIVFASNGEDASEAADRDRHEDDDASRREDDDASDRDETEGDETSATISSAIPASIPTSIIDTFRPTHDKPAPKPLPKPVSKTADDVPEKSEPPAKPVLPILTPPPRPSLDKDDKASSKGKGKDKHEERKKGKGPKPDDDD